MPHTANTSKGKNQADIKHLEFIYSKNTPDHKNIKSERKRTLGSVSSTFKEKRKGIGESKQRHLIAVANTM